MLNQHPITPPRELVREWYGSEDCPDGANALANYLCTQAAQWGADQELEACCEWLDARWGAKKQLRAARRPKPPSLKKQALAVIENFAICDHLSPQDSATIRRALEALDD
jgi:hypothetical protein